MLKRAIPLFAGILVLVSMVAMPRPQVSAEGGQAFSISPPLIELKADPGQKVNATIKFTNVSSGELLIKTQFNDFGAKNETGDPNIIFEDVPNAVFSLRQWIASPPPFKIKSQETKTMVFPITVPADAEPGGHYAVIRFTGNTPGLEESGVALTASIGSLVLMEVSGEIKESASVAEFYTPTNKGEKTGFFEHSPINLVERIRNTGNVHIKPTGTVTVKNMFGRTTDTLRVNGDPANAKDVPRSILPQSVRRFDQKLDGGFMFGRYTANMKLSYGEGQKTLTASISFWVIPYKLIILILLGGAALFFGLRYGIRAYNNHIIAKASAPPVVQKRPTGKRR